MTDCLPAALRSKGRPGFQAAGFTLIEVLLVVLILGILTSLVVLRLDPGNPRRGLHTDLQRLAQLIEHTCAQAILDAQTYGIGVDNYGYRFWRYQAPQWQALNSGWMQQYQWSNPVSIRLRVDDQVHISGTRPITNINQAPNIICSSSGNRADLKITARLIGQSEAPIRLLISATGKVEFKQ